MEPLVTEASRLGIGADDLIALIRESSHVQRGTRTTAWQNDWMRVPGSSPRSDGSSGSILSIGSSGSILSIGSSGSILSIGSAGSILSVASAGSLVSAFSVGSAVSLGSVFSVRSRWSVLARRSAERPALPRFRH